MAGTTPDFEYWRNLRTMKIWQIAVLMHDFDPRALADVTVASTDLSNHHGEALDYDDEVLRLASAVLAKEMNCCTPINFRPDGNSEIVVTELVPWLRKNGHGELADKLLPAPAGAAVGSGNSSSETKVQREDRRLQMCVEAGLNMSDPACRSRLPHGIGRVAESEGVSRQSFSADVRAALTRQIFAARAGMVVHRA